MEFYVCAHIHTVPCASCTIVTPASNIINKFGCFSLCSKRCFFASQYVISTIFAVSLVTRAICPTSCVTLPANTRQCVPTFGSLFPRGSIRVSRRTFREVVPARQPTLAFCPDYPRCALGSSHRLLQFPRRSPNLSLGVLVTLFLRPIFCESFPFREILAILFAIIARSAPTDRWSRFLWCCAVTDLCGGTDVQRSESNKSNHILFTSGF
jgi:hypothetical protein